MLSRLRTDFRLSIITLLGACAVLGITPFAFYRFYTGDLMAGIVDCLILAGIVLTVAYAWATGKTDRSGLCLAVVACSGATIVATMQGDVGIFWMFPALVGSFFLTTPRVAVTVSSLALLVLVAHNVAFDSPQQMWSFVITSIVVSACAYIFALRNESQRMQLEQLATFDPLTGVGNRRAMDEALQLAVATASRTRSSYGLVILDLDHFKRINDTHGHSVGDKVLVHCAHLVQQNIRQTDRLFRFGGEEFVVLLTGTRHEGLQSVALGLRRKLALELKGPDGAVTASFGAALLRDGEDWESWLARADAALYRAKDAGRDCIVVDGSDDAPLR
jgi:diguanylate cyclase (GGDEF)-like protein